MILETERLILRPWDEADTYFTIRELEEYETQGALSLAWEVFSEYESPDYPQEGTEEFHKCLHDDEQTVNGIRFTPMTVQIR